MYHYVRNISNSRYPGIKGLELSQFREQIRFLQQHHTFISPDELLSALNLETQLPENSVLLTFDDGYIDHYTNVFPILKEMKIPAFFSMPGKILAEKKVLDVNKIHFILARMSIEKLLPLVYQQLNHFREKGYMIPLNKELYQKLGIGNRFDGADVVFIKRLLQVELEEGLRNLIVDDLFRQVIPMPEDEFVQELYMNLDQVKEMSKTDGISFGIHGYDHYWMNRLTPVGLANDIKLALKVFEGIVNPNRWICCYPYGSYSADVIDYISKNGAVAGLGTDVNIATVNEKSRYILPRLDTNDFPPKSENYKNYYFKS